ncbi:phage tail protein [Aquitalea aquatilis]|uniref:phage tail protein n=1 Tax=Aquitalea aquatilis TaxID=1537400 RepID=UPI0010BD5A04|nr:phage tail protein [Aquitalea aquatilis]
MTIYYAKSTGGFYDDSIHGGAIPEDAVEITADEHAALLEAQAGGKVIQADSNGNPVAVDPPPPTSEQTNAAIKAQLAELDGKSVRALHEAVLALAASGAALPADTTKRLQDLETQKQALRAKLV